MLGFINRLLDERSFCSHFVSIRPHDGINFVGDDGSKKCGSFKGGWRSNTFVTIRIGPKTSSQLTLPRQIVSEYSLKRDAIFLHQERPRKQYVQILFSMLPKMKTYGQLFQITKCQEAEVQVGIVPFDIGVDDIITYKKQKNIRKNQIDFMSPFAPVQQIEDPVFDTDSDVLDVLLNSGRCVDAYGNSSLRNTFIEMFRPMRYPEVGDYNTGCITCAGIAQTEKGTLILDEHNGCFNVFNTLDDTQLCGWRAERGRYTANNFAVSPSGDVYALDRSRHRVIVYNIDGDIVRKWSDPNTEEFLYPYEIGVSPASEIFIVFESVRSIRVYTEYGIFIREISIGGEGSERWCGGLMISGDVLYATDMEEDTVSCYRASDGRLLHSFGTWGSDEGEFQRPRGLVLSSIGELYVCDEDNCRIQVFDGTGFFLRQWRLIIPLSDPPTEYNPIAIALVGTNKVYVCAYNSVLVYGQ
jgi:hypothetical protein